MIQEQPDGPRERNVGGRATRARPKALGEVGRGRSGSSPRRRAKQRGGIETFRSLGARRAAPLPNLIIHLFSEPANIDNPKGTRDTEDAKNPGTFPTPTPPQPVFGHWQ